MAFIRARLYALAGLDPAQTRTPDELAKRVLGVDYLIRAPRRSIESRGALGQWGGRAVIVVDDKLPDEELPRVVAHELGEFMLRLLAVRLPARRREALAHAFARTLLRAAEKPVRRRQSKR